MQKFIGIILMLLIGFSFKTNYTAKDKADFSARQNTEVIKDAKGEVRKIGNEDIYMIWCGEKYLKLNPFNLPEKFKQPGLKITFSGNIKEMNALEDEWGELFELTAINQ